MEEKIFKCINCPKTSETHPFLTFRQGVNGLICDECMNLESLEKLAHDFNTEKVEYEKDGFTQIIGLTEGMDKFKIKGKIIDKTDIRLIESQRRGALQLSLATLKDDTGIIVINLWNKQIPKINKNDNLIIEDGYISTFDNELRLTIVAGSKVRKLP